MNINKKLLVAAQRLKRRRTLAVIVVVLLLVGLGTWLIISINTPTMKTSTTTAPIEPVSTGEQQKAEMGAQADAADAAYFKKNGGSSAN